MVHLAMFAKYWEAGKVKTRLARTLGNQHASEVYVAFLQHLVIRFGGFGDARTLVFSPPESKEQFRDFLPESWDLEPQSPGDLGVRMKTFFAGHCKDPHKKNLLIGSDTPDLTKGVLTQAADILDECPVVLGPSEDGGYYLIGMRGQAFDLFDDVAWSTEHVLGQTIDKLNNLGVSYGLLPEFKDVDEGHDLQRLVRSLDNPNADDLDHQLLGQLKALGVSHD